MVETVILGSSRAILDDLKRLPQASHRAEARALNRMNTAIRRSALRHMAAALGVTQRALSKRWARRRAATSRRLRTGGEGLFELFPVIGLPDATQDALGVNARGRSFRSHFIRRMPSGKRIVASRKGRTRLPITQTLMDLSDEALAAIRVGLAEQSPSWDKRYAQEMRFELTRSRRGRAR